MNWIKVAVLVAAAALLSWRAVEGFTRRAAAIEKTALHRKAELTEIRVVDPPTVSQADALLGEAFAAPIGRTGARQVLQIVLGSESPKSKESSESWAKLVSAVTWKPHQQVWVITNKWHAAAELLAVQARTAGAAVRQLVVRSPGKFWRATGIGGVPCGLLILDKRLQLMALGAVKSADLEPFVQLLEASVDNYPRNPFLIDRVPDPLSPELSGKGSK